METAAEFARLKVFTYGFDQMDPVNRGRRQRR